MKIPSATRNLLLREEASNRVSEVLEHCGPSGLRQVDVVPIEVIFGVLAQSEEISTILIYLTAVSVRIKPITAWRPRMLKHLTAMSMLCSFITCQKNK